MTTDRCRPAPCRHPRLQPRSPLQQRGLVAAHSARPRGSARAPAPGGGDRRVRSGRPGGAAGGPRLRGHSGPPERAAERDRGGRERHPRLRHGLLRLPLPRGRPHPHLRGRVREQLPGLSAGGATPRGGGRADRERAGRHDLAAGSPGRPRPRRPGAPGGPDPRAHERRSREPGGGGGCRLPRGRGALPARRLPVRGPDAPGRGGPRVRRALRHRPQVPARPPRRGLPLREEFPDRTPRAPLRGPSRRDLDRPRLLRASARRQALRELGRQRGREDRPRPRGRLRPRPGSSGHSRPCRGPRRAPAPRAQGTARRPRPRPGHLEVRHRHLRHRRSWARGDPGRAPQLAGSTSASPPRRPRGSTWTPAASARWCAPPSTTTTPRTRSTASAASCAPFSEPGRQGRRSTLPVVFRPSRAR